MQKSQLFTLFVVFIQFCCFPIFAQNRIDGKTLDKFSNTPIAGVTVKLTTEKDSVLQTAATDSYGIFVFNVSSGKYLLKFTNLGHQAISKALHVNGKSIQILQLMKPSDLVLEEIEIKATPAVAIRGDTTEFDAKRFSTREYADADELVAQIPGVEIDEEGNVKAHGENVTKIIIDGKPFFSTDPRIALKTLPAEIIAKIQLIDEKSDQATFSGFDDGQRRKVINIVTKPDRKKGLFGKASAGLGDDNKFQFNSAMNRFNQDNKIAINLMANNINETNFMEQGRGGYRRGNSNVERGLAKTYAGAINYNNLFLHKKLDISADYNFRSTQTNVQTLSQTEYLLGNRANQLQNSDQSSLNQEEEHKANSRIRWNLDSMQRIDFSPNFTYRSTNRAGFNNSQTSKNENELINKSARANENGNQNLYIGADFGYFYRFKKVGRTASISFSGNKNTDEATGKNLALIHYYKDGLLSRIDTNNNKSLTHGYGSGYNARLALTENLTPNSRVQFNYSFRNTMNYSDRQTFEFLAETDQLGELNERLSNEFRNDFKFHRGGLSFTYNKKDSLRIQLGLNYQHGLRTNDRTFPINLLTKANFGSLHPELTIVYTVNPEKRWELNYNATTNTPSIYQLQDYINNQNELRISNGNPNLNQEYSHNVKIQYKDVKRSNGQNLNINLDFSYTNDKIVNSVLTTDTAIVLFDDIVLGAGGQYTIPVNVNGAYNTRMSTSFGLPIERLKLNINLNNSIYYNSNFAVLNDEFLNGYTYGIQQRVGIHTNISKLFVSGVNYRINLNFTNNPIANNGTYKVYTHTVNHTLTYEFLNALVFNSSLFYNYNSSILNAPPLKTLIWNASFGKRLFKRKHAEIAIKAFDIFNQSQNINRRLTEIAITNSTSNTLARYFMLAFTYDLRNFGGNERKK